VSAVDKKHFGSSKRNWTFQTRWWWWWWWWWWWTSSQGPN